MAKTKTPEPKKSRRNFPQHTLQDALAVPQKIADEKGGRPFKRILLADALGYSPGSSNIRDLLSSSYKYGLTDGTEKATEISLTKLGTDATQTQDAQRRLRALREVALIPDVFKKFYEDYSDRKIPNMMNKILVSDYGVPEEHVEECARTIIENGRFTGLVRDVSGSAHVLLDAEVNAGEMTAEEGEEVGPEPDDSFTMQGPIKTDISKAPERAVLTEPPKAIFIGHGKNKAPLQKLQRILSSFQIPHKVTIDEANLGRPIPQKVKETMLQCGSAILIFTRDEKFHDEDGNEIWRPSENVVHELGASSFAYGDRVVILKEKGLHFPTNYQSIGYIEFEIDSIDATTTDLLKELIGFGLVRITPT
jgi:hypothetical protein